VTNVLYNYKNDLTFFMFKKNPNNMYNEPTYGPRKLGGLCYIPYNIRVGQIQ